MIYTVAQFIPIIVLFLLVTYSKNVVIFSNTVLGKLIAICIIIFYTFLDKLLGAAVCLFIVFYYQSDLVESMLNMDNDLNDLNDLNDSNDLNSTAILANEKNFVDDYVYIDKEKSKKEGIINYGDEYYKDILINNDVKQSKFRNDNCEKGELINKDLPVNYEMTEHVFPELKFRRGFCNPCLKDCEFSIIDEKLAMEDKLLREIKKK
jgi:hypothetical protein